MKHRQYSYYCNSRVLNPESGLRLWYRGDTSDCSREASFFGLGRCVQAKWRVSTESGINVTAWFLGLGFKVLVFGYRLRNLVLSSGFRSLGGAMKNCIKVCWQEQRSYSKCECRMEIGGCHFLGREGG